jgi:hypothetical protein
MYIFESVRMIADAAANDYTNLATRMDRTRIIRDMLTDECNRNATILIWTLLNLCDYVIQSQYHHDQKTALGLIVLLIDNHLESLKTLHDPIAEPDPADHYIPTPAEAQTQATASDFPPPDDQAWVPF